MKTIMKEVRRRVGKTFYSKVLMKEFNLSEKIKKRREELCGIIMVETPFSDLTIKDQLDLVTENYDELIEDVKEFIKRLKEELQNEEKLWKIPDEIIFSKIDKLAGDKL